MKKIFFVSLLALFFLLPGSSLAQGSLGANGDSCLSDDVCVSGFCDTQSSTCIDPPASPPPPPPPTLKANGEGCVVSDQCASDYCDPDTYECADKPAQSQSNKAIGAACVNSSECASNYCDANKKCAVQAPIDPPVTPPTTAPSAQKALGVNCQSDAECSSGYCELAFNTCSNKPAAAGGNTNATKASPTPSNCTPVAAGLIPVECQCDAKGCTLKSVERAIANVAQFILGSIGGLALLMFVYGGLMYIVGGAVSSQTNKSKEIMKYAAEGLIIVMLSGVILKTILKALL